MNGKLKVAVAGAVALAAVVACGPSRSSVSPSARASGKAIAHGIATGQAAQKAEGVVRACAARYSGIFLIHCIAPQAPKGARRKAFDHCAINAMAQDIPGQEVKFVQTDLPNCLVASR